MIRSIIDYIESSYDNLLHVSLFSGTLEGLLTA